MCRKFAMLTWRSLRRISNREDPACPHHVGHGTASSRDGRSKRKGVFSRNLEGSHVDFVLRLLILTLKVTIVFFEKQVADNAWLQGPFDQIVSVPLLTGLGLMERQP